MRKVGFAFDEACFLHEPPPWHPDSKDRLLAVMDVLEKSGMRPNLIPLEPRKAGIEDLVRVHTAEYIESIRSFGSGELDPDTYLSHGSFTAASHAAGSVL